MRGFRAPTLVVRLRAGHGHTIEGSRPNLPIFQGSSLRGALLRGGSMAALVVLLWMPLIATPGIVFTRDPAFFATVHADWSSSLGVLSQQGGASSLSNQGLFYEPYALVEAVLGWAGLPAGMISKVVMIAISIVAVVGCYRLLRHLDVDPWPAVIGSGVFLLNPWSLDQFGYFFIWTGYCLLPVVVLGVAQTYARARPPVTLFVALAYSGGLVAWAVACLVAGVTVVAHAERHSRARWTRSAAWVLGVFVGAAAYWLLPYAVWVLHPGSSEYQRFAHVTGGLLQSPYPVTGLLDLRDFWWPHLEPASVAGYTAAAVAGLAAMVLVLGAVAWCGFVWSRNFAGSGRGLRSSALLLVVCGAVLAVGTAGPTGWLYAAIHDGPLPGHVFVAGLMRSPSNFAGIFVVGMVMALAAGVNEMWRSSGLKRSLGLTSVFVLAVLACGPSVLAFWQQYQPISPPSYYARAASSLPRGVVLEVGLWHDVLISPIDGVAHFVWSNRMVADPTMLASFVAAPSLSPELAGNDDVGRRVLGVVRPGGVHALEALGAALHVRTLVIENDLIRGGASPLPAVLQALRRSGVAVRAVGPLVVVSLARTSKPAVWVRGCKVGSGLALFGAFHLSCRSSSTGRFFRSAFGLPGPLLGVGVTVGSLRSIAGGLGTVASVTGRDGWILSLPGMLAAVGLLVTTVVIVVVTSRRAWSGLRRRRQRV